MKKNKILIICSFLFSFIISYAQNVDERTARNIGINFLASKKTTTNPTQSRTSSQDFYELAYTATKEGKVCYYVYNCNNGGYVIVSADGRSIAPVLGYSTEGYFDYDRLGDNARGWIDTYKDQIFAIDSIVASTPGITTYKRTKLNSKRLGKRVEPLLGDIAWDQGYPYNIMCPNNGSDFCLTGCVATAVSQIMYYHNWPNQGFGIIGGYSGYDQEDLDLSKSHYEWDIMLPTYSDTSNTEANKAVASLMRDVGYAVGASYGFSATSALDNRVPTALVNNFDYDLSLSYKERRYLSDEEWDNMLISEIDSQRPCYYSGGDHAFVCDGYDYTDNNEIYFHFNFGWSGFGNGFFLSDAVLDYNSYQAAVIGIRKNEGGKCHAEMYSNDYLVWKTYDEYPWNEVYIGETLISAIGNGQKKQFSAPDLFIEDLMSGTIKPFSGVMPEVLSYEISYVNSIIPVFTELDDGEYAVYWGAWDLMANKLVKCHYPESTESFVSITVKNGKYTIKNNPEYALPGEGIVYIDGLYYSLDDSDKTAVVENRNGQHDSPISSYYGNIVIPKTVIWNDQVYKVTKIGSFAFCNCQIENIYIPQTIEYIGASAFAASRIKYVEFEENSNLKKIGNSAFYNCAFFRSISLPENLKEIESGAFYLCQDIRTIDIPASVDIMGDDVFLVSLMTDITVNWTTPKEMDGAFDFEGITESVVLHVPEGTKELYESMECWSRFEIIEGIWSDKIKIGGLWYYLNESSKIAKFTNPDISTDSEGYGSFVEIPSTVEYEGNTYSVERIDSYCLNATITSEIFIPKTVKVLEDFSFAYNNLEKIDFEEDSELSEIGSFAFFNSDISHIELPKGLKKIGEQAFKNTNLLFIRIPYTVNEISYDPFPDENFFKDVIVEWEKDLSSLKVSYIAPNNRILHVPNGTTQFYLDVFPWSQFDIVEEDFSSQIVSIDGIKYMLMDPSQTAIVMRNSSESGQSRYKGDILIPNKIDYQGKTYIPTEIGARAFVDCEEIGKVHLPKEVTTISNNAFSGCNLIDLIVERNSNLTTIGNYAFEYCRNFRFDLSQFNQIERIGVRAFYGCEFPDNIEIPKTVCEIESEAFNHWLDNLSSVSVKWEKPINISNYAFGSIDRMSQATLNVPKGTKESYESTYPWAYFGNIVEVENLGLEILMENVTLDVDELFLEIGDTHQFVVTVIPADATSPEVEWWIDDETVAKIDENGFVTIVGEGSTTVHVRSLRWHEIEATCRLNVTNGIESVFEEDNSCDIYTPTGILLKKSVPVSELQNLDHGIYIICYGGKMTKILK